MRSILSYLLLSFLVITISSCSSDDDNNAPEATLLGSWDVTEFRLDGTFIIEGMHISFDGVADSLPGNDATFHEDNTFDGNSAPFEMNVQYVINGVPINETLEMSSVMVNKGTWSREGDVLHFEEDVTGEKGEYNIDILTATTLKLSADQDSMDLGDDFPAGSEFRARVTLSR